MIHHSHLSSLCIQNHNTSIPPIDLQYIHVPSGGHFPDHEHSTLLVSRSNTTKIPPSARITNLFSVVHTSLFSLRRNKGRLHFASISQGAKDKGKWNKGGWVRGYPIRRLRDFLFTFTLRIGFSPRGADSGHSAFAAQSWAFSSDDSHCTGHLWSGNLYPHGTFAFSQWTFIHGRHLIRLSRLDEMRYPHLIFVVLNGKTSNPVGPGPHSASFERYITIHLSAVTTKRAASIQKVFRAMIFRSFILRFI